MAAASPSAFGPGRSNCVWWSWPSWLAEAKTWLILTHPPRVNLRKCGGQSQSAQSDPSGKVLGQTGPARVPSFRRARTAARAPCFFGGRLSRLVFGAAHVACTRYMSRAWLCTQTGDAQRRTAQPAPEAPRAHHAVDDDLSDGDPYAWWPVNGAADGSTGAADGTGVSGGTNDDGSDDGSDDGGWSQLDRLRWY